MKKIIINRLQNDIAENNSVSKQRQDGKLHLFID